MMDKYSMADNMDKYIIDNIKLSACRHCGGEAELYTHHDVINDEDIAFIMCKKCGIQTREVDISIRFDSPFSIQDQCKWTPLKDIIKECIVIFRVIMLWIFSLSMLIQTSI